MRRHLAMLGVIAVVAAACSSTSEPGSTTTSAPVASSTTTTAAVTTTTAATTTTEAAATTTEAPRRAFDGGLTGMLGNGPAEWDSAYIDPGGVIVHEGVFHSFYNGIPGWPDHARVGHATSTDGFEWEKQATEPLFTGEGLPWVGISLFVHDAIVLDDGTWALYFSGAVSSTNFADGDIGMATAPGPDGPWTVQSDPVFRVGGEGSWDGSGVVDPSVLRIGDQYVMYYDGNNRGVRSIGIATSPDGYAWERLDGTGGPVLEAGEPGAWDETGVYAPQVVHTDEGYIMNYFVRKPGTSAPEYLGGLAYSDDGFTWEKDPSGGFLSSAAYGFSGIFLSSMVHANNTYFLYFDAQRGPGGGTTAFMVTHEGPLRNR